MKPLPTDISFLKNILEKRETYIRFSPIWTIIMGIMYILYYSYLSHYFENELFFLAIAALWITGVTLLSLLESKKRKEELLPKSIQYIIGNLITISITYISIIHILMLNNISDYIIPIWFLFYGGLILICRLHIQKFIKIFGIIIFLAWLFQIFITPYYTQEIVLLFLWVGHIIIGGLLYINNNK